jgi:hypothetical protein
MAANVGHQVSQFLSTRVPDGRRGEVTESYSSKVY